MELKLQHISKSYGKNKALADFSMTFTPGVYALLGPNGSGKSTLMNIITDNLKENGGEITYNGEPIKKMGAVFREKLGFMPQYPGMYPHFTAREFLCYMGTLKGIPKKEIPQKTEEVLKAVELSDVAGQKISSYSGGMKQRLALAQATMGNPEIIILDEPTAGLDPKQRIAIRNYIASIALQKIVMIATHVVSDIEFIAKEVIILKKGVIIDCDIPSALIAKMENHVFLISCAEEEIETMESKWQIIHIAKQEGNRVQLRVVGDSMPEGAEPVTPTLEDYYLYIFGEKSEK